MPEGPPPFRLRGVPTFPILTSAIRERLRIDQIMEAERVTYDDEEKVMEKADTSELHAEDPGTPELSLGEENPAELDTATPSRASREDGTLKEEQPEETGQEGKESPATPDPTTSDKVESSAKKEGDSFSHTTSLDVAWQELEWDLSEDAESKADLGRHKSGLFAILPTSISVLESAVLGLRHQGQRTWRFYSGWSTKPRHLECVHFAAVLLQHHKNGLEDQMRQRRQEWFKQQRLEREKAMEKVSKSPWLRCWVGDLLSRALMRQSSHKNSRMCLGCSLREPQLIS